MSNLITEIYDKQAVVDNLNQLGELINSSLNAIVASAPKLQSPIDYLTAVQSISEIEKKNTEVTQAKAKALSDLDKAYQQADKAIQQSINLEDAEFQAQTKLTSQYKERAKEQKQLLELERTRQQTMQNGNKLLQMEAKSEGELRMQQQQLIKAQQSLRVTNAEENALREKLIAKINANKEALKGMSDEVSKQRDNIGNYKSALEGNVNVLNLVSSGQLQLKEAMKLVRTELTQLETLQASGNQLTAEQRKRYNDLSLAMGQLSDIQGDISAQTKVLADDYRGMTFALESVKLGVNIMSSLQAVTALVGGENEELQKTMAKIVAVQQILNTLSQIENQLNSKKEIMIGLRLIKEKLLTTAIGEQTKAQLALNAAKLGFIGLAAGAVAGLTIWIAKMASAKAEVADLSKELNKQAAEAIAENVAKLDELKQSWTNLGGNLEEQQKFLDKNKDKLAEMGLAFNDVNDAEEFFENQTDKYIEAITARAKAEAARQMIIEKQKEALEAEMNAERIAAGQTTLWEDVKEGLLSASYGAENAKNIMVGAAKEEADAAKDAINALKEKEKAYIDEAKAAESTVPAMTAAQKAAEEKAEADKKAAEAAKALSSAQERVNESYERQASIIRMQYLESVRDMDGSVEKIMAKKKEEAQLIDLEIAKYQQLNTLLSPQSLAYQQNAEKIAELTNKKQELYQVNVISEEEEEAMNDTLYESIDLRKKQADVLGDDVIDAAELYREELKDIDAEEEEYLKRLKKRTQDRKEAYDDMVDNVGSAFDALLGYVDQQKEADEDWYNYQKELIENGIHDEELREARLASLDAEKLKRDKETAKKEAEIKRRQAIFNNAIKSAEAMSEAVASVGKLLAKETEGDTYSAVARYIAAIAAGISAVTTVASLISQLVRIPAFEKGGTAEANKPFIAGEKGREIGFGVYSGKVYDFSKPTLFKANEPINIKNANETKQIINNTNEYNKDVTLHNEVVVNVIDNKRVQKYFKIGGKA
ncbi:MAG: hypothetical protein II027_03155 [Bacteroidales bacterium]|nr:hypothetical protein [Bacteroidales bacterium]